MTHAATGTAAAQALADPRNRFDVAILDIELPGKTGLELAAGLADEASAPMLIAMTAHGSGQDRARTKSAGFDAHLTKPVDPCALAALLDPPPRALRAGHDKRA